MLHRYAQVVAGCTVLLVLAGSLVTSTGSGLSVPDWPTSYGWNMFAFPPSKWVGGILYEHGHRLIASTVGLLTVLLAVWVWLREPRRWLKWTAAAALVAVIAQGVLGGLTVLFFLPAAISTAHAALAEIFFCLVVAIALFTSPRWMAAGDTGSSDSTLRTLATTTTALVYAQILVGATMRHTGAGLAIPDFPLMFGGLLPDHWNAKIAVHFAHRIGALVVALSVALVGIRVRRVHARPEFVGPAAILATLVVVQIALGAVTVLSARNVWINSLHVVCGALVLTTSLVLALRCWRDRFPDRAWPETDAAIAAAAGRASRPDDRSRLQPVRGARA